MAKKRMYKFTEKSQSKRGILTSVFAICLLGVYGVCVYLAYRGNGGLNTYFGSIGVIAMLLSVIDFGFALTTLKEEDSFLFFPRFAVITSFLAAAGWIGTYIAGIV